VLGFALDDPREIEEEEEDDDDVDDLLLIVAEDCATEDPWNTDGHDLLTEQ